MAKKKTQIKKPSIAAILGMILLGLVLVGVVANVIKSNPKEEEDPIVDVEPGEDEELELLSLSIDGSNIPTDNITIEYVEGMTWGEWVESEYNKLGFEIYEHKFGGDQVRYYIDYNGMMLMYGNNGSDVTFDAVINNTNPILFKPNTFA